MKLLSQKYIIPLVFVLGAVMLLNNPANPSANTASNARSSYML